MVSQSAVKGTMGWFYDFNHHLIMNDEGGLLADNEYISTNLKETFVDKGINFITG
jgi:hypothetical protein